MKYLILALVCLNLFAQSPSGGMDSGGGDSLLGKLEFARTEAIRVLEYVDTYDITNPEFEDFYELYRDFLILELETADFKVLPDSDITDLIQGYEIEVIAKTSHHPGAPIYFAYHKVEEASYIDLVNVFIHEVMHHTGRKHETWEERSFFEKLPLHLMEVQSNMMKEIFYDTNLSLVPSQTTILFKRKVVLRFGSQEVYFQNNKVFYSLNQLNFTQAYCYLRLKEKRAENVIIPQGQLLEITLSDEDSGLTVFLDTSDINAKNPHLGRYYQLTDLFLNSDTLEALGCIDTRFNTNMLKNKIKLNLIDHFEDYIQFIFPTTISE
ncbi:MAG: hypothetical protein H6620_12080 [Halobacteriovoraceae bacterium]|nr:hypothetical protein [Halobacteriovoraceae bacterium]